MRSVKVRAAQADATLTDTITALLRSALAESSGRSAVATVSFPLVLGARRATADELSAERIAELDAAQDLASADVSA